MADRGLLLYNRTTARAIQIVLRYIDYSLCQAC
jgi:hypothetical protein